MDRGAPPLFLLLTTLLLVVPLTAQDPDSLAVVGGRLLLTPDRPPEPGQILIREGRIVAVGADLEIPAASRRVEASGSIVAPAFIDAGQTGLLDEASGTAGPTGAGDRTSEMISFMDPVPRRRLLRAGVGAAYLELLPGRRLKGPAGAVVLVDPADDGLPLVQEIAGVTFGVGGRNRNESTLFLRKASHANITAALSAARRYRESWRKYEKELSEYEDKLKKWEEAKKKGVEPGKADAGSGERRSPPSGERSGRGGDGTLPPDFREWSRERRREYLQERMRRAREGSSSSGQKDAGAGDQGTGAKPKRPLPPKYDPASEAMVQVMEGKIPLRVEAHWKEDILAALDLARERNVPLVLIGATEAREVLERIREAGVGVILGPAVDFGSDPLEQIRREPGLARDLAAAGIPVAFMSAGAAGYREDSLPLMAALAMAEGLPREAALRALTADAARLLGLGARLGSLEVGQDAVLQILSGPPLEPGTRVERMILRDRVVETAEGFSR